MDKKNRIIITVGVFIIIAAVALIVLVGMSDDSKKKEKGAYTLQPTTTQPTVVNTDSWVDLNQIVSEMATASDTSDPSATGVLTTGPSTVPLFYDAYGNIVDANGNIIYYAYQLQGNGNQNPNNGNGNSNVVPPTTIDSTQALDQPFEGEVSEYEINSQGLITDYLGDDSYVLIPDKINGVTVKGIGTGAFENNSIIEFVQIPASVTVIGDYAFKGCSKLGDVAFVSNTTKVSIGQGAFEKCYELKKIELPVVEILGRIAFGDCVNLTSVRLAEGSKEIKQHCFSGCTRLETVIIPASVDTFGIEIFSGVDKTKVSVVTPMDSKAWEYAEQAGVNVTTHE